MVWETGNLVFSECYQVSTKEPSFIKGITFGISYMCPISVFLWSIYLLELNSGITRNSPQIHPYFVVIYIHTMERAGESEREGIHTHTHTLVNVGETSSVLVKTELDLMELEVFESNTLYPGNIYYRLFNC